MKSLLEENKIVSEILEKHKTEGLSVNKPIIDDSEKPLAYSHFQNEVIESMQILADLGLIEESQMPKKKMLNEEKEPSEDLEDLKPLVGKRFHVRSVNPAKGNSGNAIYKGKKGDKHIFQGEEGTWSPEFSDEDMEQVELVELPKDDKKLWLGFKKGEPQKFAWAGRIAKKWLPKKEVEESSRWDKPGLGQDDYKMTPEKLEGLLIDLVKHGDINKETPEQLSYRLGSTNQEIIDGLKKLIKDKVIEIKDDEIVLVKKSAQESKQVSNKVLNEEFDPEEYLEQYRDHDSYADYNLMLDRGLYLLAADFILGSGAAEGKAGKALEKMLAKASKKDLEDERKELLKDVEIWVHPKTNEHAFLDVYQHDASQVEELKKEGYEFDSRYDKNGNLKKDSNWAEEEIKESKKAVSEKYVGFEKLVGELKKKQAADPEALAAWIDRKKYGKSKFQEAAAKGAKLKESLFKLFKMASKLEESTHKESVRLAYFLSERIIPRMKQLIEDEEGQPLEVSSEEMDIQLIKKIIDALESLKEKVQSEENKEELAAVILDLETLLAQEKSEEGSEDKESEEDEEEPKEEKEPEEDAEEPMKESKEISAKLKKVWDLMKKAKVETDMASPNLVADYAKKAGVKLSSAEVVQGSDEYKLEPMKEDSDSKYFTVWMELEGEAPEVYAHFVDKKKAEKALEWAKKSEGFVRAWIEEPKAKTESIGFNLLKKKI